MALLNTLPTQYGVDATYWKITAINTNYLQKSTEVKMSGWVDEQARIDKTPISYRSFIWLADEFPFVEDEPQNERLIAYSKIKQTNEFLSATDI